MTHRRVLGILDRPSPNTLGFLALVVENSQGALHAEGLSASTDSELSSRTYAELVARGEAVAIDAVSINFDETPATAVWLGDEFANEADAAGVPLPPIGSPTTVLGVDGKYWIAPQRHAWRLFESWIAVAFRLFAVNGNRRLARLLYQAAPDRLEARTALWFSSASDTEKERHLDWWIRLSRDRGEIVDASILLAQMKSLHRDSQLVEPARVIGFAAPAKGGDKEIATQVAKLGHIARRSFGNYLSGLSATLGQPSDRRSLQQLGQDTISKFGELAFCMRVLDDLPKTDYESPFLIEGIRHRLVLSAMKQLVGADRFRLAYVDRPEVERRSRLMEDEHLSETAVSEVLHDPTEQEVPELAGHANFLVDADEPGHDAELVMKRFSLASDQVRQESHSLPELK